MTEIIELDRRQRLAACALLMAFDLPANANAAGEAMIAAAKVCPGVKFGELPPMGPGGRRRYLERARELIDEMLAEYGGA